MLVLTQGMSQAMSEYPEIRPTFERTYFPIRIVWHETIESIREVCPKDKLACAKIRLLGKIPIGDCVIHSFRPKTLNDLTTLVMGHELEHCIFGDYHRHVTEGLEEH